MKALDQQMIFLKQPYKNPDLLNNTPHIEAKNSVKATNTSTASFQSTFFTDTVSVSTFSNTEKARTNLLINIAWLTLSAALSGSLTYLFYYVVTHN